MILKTTLVAVLAFFLIVLGAALLHGQTNVVSVTNLPPTLLDPSAQQAANYLDKLVQWNDKLLGLPALPFIIVVCIAFGYFVKGIPFIGDEWVPFWCYTAGIVGYSVLGLLTINFNAPPHVTAAVLFKNAAIGMIGGVSARIIYRRIIKPLEKRFGMCDGDTEFRKKSDT